MFLGYLKWKNNLSQQKNTSLVVCIAQRRQKYVSYETVGPLGHNLRGTCLIVIYKYSHLAVLLHSSYLKTDFFQKFLDAHFSKSCFKTMNSLGDPWIDEYWFANFLMNLRLCWRWLKQSINPFERTFWGIF